MNRIQFFTLIVLSSLVVMLLVGQILLAHQVAVEQVKLAQAQQVINQAQIFQGNLKELAVRIYEDSQKTQDAGLKDLLVRQQISYTPNASGGTNSTAAPANPSPSTH